MGEGLACRQHEEPPESGREKWATTHEHTVVHPDETSLRRCLDASATSDACSSPPRARGRGDIGHRLAEIRTRAGDNPIWLSMRIRPKLAEDRLGGSTCAFAHWSPCCAVGVGERSSSAGSRAAPSPPGIIKAYEQPWNLVRVQRVNFFFFLLLNKLCIAERSFSA